MLTHDQRRALIEKPFPIVYIPPTKRWGGVQVINDQDWMREADMWRIRYDIKDQELEALL